MRDEWRWETGKEKEKGVRWWVLAGEEIGYGYRHGEDEEKEIG